MSHRENRLRELVGVVDKARQVLAEALYGQIERDEKLVCTVTSPEGQVKIKIETIVPDHYRHVLTSGEWRQAKGTEKSKNKKPPIKWGPDKRRILQKLYRMNNRPLLKKWLIDHGLWKDSIPDQFTGVYSKHGLPLHMLRVKDEKQRDCIRLGVKI
jgi:hypothetical protein